MRTHFDCFPCFLRQALDAIRLVNLDNKVQEQLFRDVLRWMSEMDLSLPPPVITQLIHRRIRDLSGQADPYLLIKKEQNQLARVLLGEMSEQIKNADDPLEMAIRLAIAGNVIDMGVKGKVTEEELRNSLGQALIQPIWGNIDAFRQKVKQADSILYLADNAGEIVFDRLLIQALAPARVSVAVRGGPVINDATWEDALAVGIGEVAELIDNGSDAPGTVLSDCSDDFCARFASADLVIAKGQGNVETLSQAPREIFFLFKVKCDVIAGHTGIPLGTHALLHYNGMPSQEGK